MEITRLRTLGHLARETLDRRGEFSIMGQTSKGLFLMAPTKRIVFLAYHPQQGPMTGSLETVTETIVGLQNGQKAYSKMGSLDFPGFSLEYQQAEIWIPTAAPIPINKEKGLQNLKELVNAIDEPSEPNSLYPILTDLLHEMDGYAPNHTEEPALKIRKTLAALLERNEESAVEHASKIIGEGRGLTPAGDDFIIGLLLGLNRYITLSALKENTHIFNEEILRIAEDKTTSLSKTMFWTASLGEADAGLMAALDFLFAGKGNVDKIAKYLNHYGSSSGIDTLSGIAVAVLSSTMQ